MGRVVAYVSSHGFGHATRTAEVLRVVREGAPTLPISIVGSAPAQLLVGKISGPVEVRSIECDVGLVQRGPLAIDETASLRRWREFVRDWEQRVEREREWLLEVDARVVLGDVPPLAFEAAARAGVPSVAVANFSWDWIYRHLAERDPGMTEAADWAASAYRQAGLLLRLPFSGDLSVFARIEDVPLVARRPQRAAEESRQRLGLANERAVLWSFGGHALASFDLRVLGQLDRFRFVVTDAVGEVPTSVAQVSDAQLERLGLSYIDLVAAADVVVTKPGYGIVSDAIGARTRLVYTERGDFPEYPILVREMAEYLPCAYVSNEDLKAGRLAAALGAVMDAPWPEAPQLDGASVVARRLLAIAGVDYIPISASSGMA
jgi:hypothetical protein